MIPRRVSCGQPRDIRMVIKVIRGERISVPWPVGFVEGRSLLWQLGLVLILGGRDRSAAVASNTVPSEANSMETRRMLRCDERKQSSTVSKLR